MASSLKLYTTGPMEKAFYYYVGSQAAGHPKENMIDNNLDTYWKPTSSSTTMTKMDLSEPKLVNCAILFLKNYKEITSGTWQPMYYSGSWFAVTGGALTDSSTPIRLSTFSPRTYQEWAITYYSPSHAPEVAAAYVGQLFEINQGNEYPEADADRFYNRAAQLPGGRLGIVGINKNSSRLISRQYLFSGLTKCNELRNAFLDSAGRRFPLVLNEGSAQSDALLVRFANDEFAENETDYQLFQPSVSFIELPYIDDGDLY